ncbi:hypothetical protein DM860_000931 [Cuscuta australis]|uniref:Uncharacterized protein n=1 Tax=Cuscuta australis TaxID=267555 RepID=A0A328DWP6_9ASTE|nr:hypothetical protein DM860_000931 [Cuscuta australis]
MDRPKTPAAADSRPPSCKEDPHDSIRHPKRRKSCPLTPLHSVARTYDDDSARSFTFDTKFSDGFSPETTPRFGYFNCCTQIDKAPGEDRIGEGEVIAGDENQNKKGAVG